MKIIITTISLIIVSLTTAISQENSISAFKSEDLNWFNLDINDNQIMGASVNKTYQELLINKKAKKGLMLCKKFCQNHLKPKSRYKPET